MPAIDVADEFETIERLLRPLAHPEWSRGLADDVAALPSRPGHDLILTQDTIVEGVHFLPEDPLDTVARKLLRVNLSDLASKGAEPAGYMLSCAWSQQCGWPEREAFAAGLAADQQRFGIALLGGDTVVTPGPASFSATMMGWLPKGRIVSRAGARPGDVVLVTGVIGDGLLGLRAARGELNVAPERLDALAAHYRTPEPRLAIADAVRTLATAAIDVSDGLIADIGHIARASGVAVDVTLETLPLSLAASAWFEGRVDPVATLSDLATGGDDYELAVAVRPGDEGAFRQACEREHLRVTAVGRVAAGAGVRVTYQGAHVAIGSAGWRHR